MHFSVELLVHSAFADKDFKLMSAEFGAMDHDEAPEEEPGSTGDTSESEA